MNTDIKELNKLIRVWESRHGTKLIVYCSGETGRPLSQDVIPVIYRILENTRSQDMKLDLLIATEGGTLSAAYRLVKLIREFCTRFRVVVPCRARSAGSLVAIGADQILMGPLGELSPLDPSVRCLDSSGRGSHELSAEEVRLSLKAAGSWFRMNEQRCRETVYIKTSEVVSLVTISALYRAEQYAINVASELAVSQVPDQRKRIVLVKKFVQGFHDHTHGITRVEATSLGLKVENVSLEDERDMTSMWRSALATMQNDGEDGSIRALIAAREGAYCYRMLGLPTKEKIDLRSNNASGWELLFTGGL